MPSPKYYVVGATHIDLAWKKAGPEMAEMQETLVIHLLDALDHDPAFTYVLEQAAHYRQLAKSRPDLIERLKVYLQQGRLEFMGGLASTLETNIPNGECFVRNQLIGQHWIRQHFGVEAETGWLIDTFGINAQVPQILQQFGIHRLMANRFGNVINRDVFVARGLDGSQLLVAGRDVYSPFVRPEHVFFEFTGNWESTDCLFQKAASNQGSGPCLVTPYLENEHLLSLHYLDLVNQANQETPGAWVNCLPRDFFDALEAHDQAWPVLAGDLNPEFTATFSQRFAIRQRNRHSETQLLEAEKWASLLRLPDWQADLQAAWWTMAFNHFHDVFTGSHPTRVFNDVIANFDGVDRASSAVLKRASHELLAAEPSEITVLAFNGLPWHRTDIIRLTLPENIHSVQTVYGPQGALPFEVRGNEVRFLAEIPAVGAQAFRIESGPSTQLVQTLPAGEPSETAVIENEFVRFECDRQAGIRSLVWKGSGAVLLENCGDFLIVQKDEGSFQIESPQGTELPACAGDITGCTRQSTPIGQHLTLQGVFPKLPWAGPDNRLAWQIEFSLLNGQPALEVALTIHWKGEASRLRFKLATCLDSSEGIFEIPFGVVHRKPYGVRGNARGEWPAHRFVTIEDQQHGLALANTGTPGVEINGGTIWTTLLRAPKSEYAGMLPDDTSSQHGEHHFQFRILPYTGKWENAGIHQAAQALNNPIYTQWVSGVLPALLSGLSWLKLEPSGLVLSAIKLPEESGPETSAGDLLVRFYETTGHACMAKLYVHQAASAWRSDLRESRFEPVACQHGHIEVAVKPFEIVTLRVTREA